MNKGMMYRDGRCVMCGVASEAGSDTPRPHGDGCPGGVVERLAYSVTAKFWRPDDGDADWSVCGPDAVEAAAKAAHRLFNCGCRPRHTVTLDVALAAGVDGGAARKTFALEIERLDAEEKRDREERRRSAFERRRSEDIAALEAEREDLKPEAYDRKLRIINERKMAT
jgi:hypothetical protein